MTRSILIVEDNEQLRGTQEKLKHFLSKNPAVLYSLKFEAGSLTPSWVNISPMSSAASARVRPRPGCG